MTTSATETNLAAAPKILILGATGPTEPHFEPFLINGS
jgi:hypothetical protein